MTHREWYQCHEFYGRKFLGVEALKNPLDAWSMQELLWECKPRTLIETGTYCGGSAKYYAAIMDAMGQGELITIDKEPLCCIEHPRVTQLVGDCQELVEEVKRLAKPPIMVVLDCCHTTEHVLAELDTYGQLVTRGQYLIVEDTCFDDQIHGAGKAMREWYQRVGGVWLRDNRFDYRGMTYNWFVRRME